MHNNNDNNNKFEEKEINIFLKNNNNNILVFRWPRTSNVDVRYTSKLKNSTATYLIIITMGENLKRKSRNFGLILVLS